VKVLRLEPTGVRQLTEADLIDPFDPLAVIETEPGDDEVAILRRVEAVREAGRPFTIRDLAEPGCLSRSGPSITVLRP
jgi:hypothetical protein